MAGAVDVIGAATLEELEQKVSDWYAEAAREGFEASRIPWNPDAAVQTGEGYEFAVWAHSAE